MKETLAMARRALWGAWLALAATGCSHPISKALRQQAAKAPPFATVLQRPEAYRGVTVLWGGQIVETLNRPGGTDLIVLETPLDSLGRPGKARESRGRFLLRTPDFLDPAIYRPEWEVTAAGEIVGAERRSLGQAHYSYPVVRIRELHLWEPPMPRDDPRWRFHIMGGWGHWHPPYWYDPWYGY